MSTSGEELPPTATQGMSLAPQSPIESMTYIQFEAGKMHVDARDGLAWDESGFDLTPVWTREPKLEAIENVCRNSLSLDDMETCDVTFYAEGSFNKLYLARTSNRLFLMRVSLPVHPHSKTLGEVTTLQFLRRATNIPVPEIFAYDESASNEIGYEWILMELKPGVPAYKKWRTLTTFQKAALVQQIAEFQAQMCQHTFSGIGTLTPGEEAAAQNEKPGEIVSTSFFSGNRFNFDIPRGPFRSTHDWLVSYLKFVIKNHTLVKEEAEDEEDKEDAAFALSVANRLVELLPKIFPALQNPPNDPYFGIKISISTISWWMRKEKSPLSLIGNVSRPCHLEWLLECQNF